MSKQNLRGVWISKILLLTAALSLSACATNTTVAPAPVTSQQLSDEDDFSQLIAQMRADLNRQNARETVRTPTVSAATTTTKARNQEFADRARALFSPLNGRLLRMPVVGVRATDLDDSWGNPRSGGRKHKGIDIFAPKGTPLVAVADGIVSYIGDQSKGGHCLWLTTEDGTSFYYAHLDRWAAGLYEGMEVKSGDLLGFVGNTGNAISTPPHLHFQVSDNDETVNPYPILVRATPVARAQVKTELSGGFGTR
jgi:peptidoglycan LD-endopeptidase LytH